MWPRRPRRNQPLWKLKQSSWISTHTIHNKEANNSVSEDPAGMSNTLLTCLMPNIIEKDLTNVIHIVE